MNHKLLIIVISGLTAIGGSFLFSKNQPELKSQSANMAEVVAPPAPSKTSIPKIKPTPHLVTPLLSSSPTPIYGSTPSPSLSATPLPTKTPAPTATPNLETPFPSSSISTSTPTPTDGLAQSDKININMASQEELEKITGVGPVIAQRIIDYRQTNGPFQKVEDIKNVKGIGDKTFEKMKNEITI